MRDKLCALCMSVFCLLPFCAFADDVIPNELVPIGSQGSTFEGYMPCEVADPACEASVLQKVTISSFYIQKYEVTLGQVKSCFDHGVCHTESLKKYMEGVLRDPKVSLNAPLLMEFEQAEAYCADNGMRLPKPEEWLYAAMGADIKSYPWGNEKTEGEYAPLSREFGEAIYHYDVGSYPKDYSVNGVYDMAGNVGEWVAGPRMGVFEEGMKCGIPYTWPAMGNADQVKIYERFGAMISPRTVGVRCAKDY
ncbi:MAG: SUMF1/EgtB/PvdO family nonheme iron enzyme [Proteobacteria bacterium]|nr:SUMF1/EgtB/PvdO family nonheme iron enzyme [Pseudomonadota bacterium]